MCAARVRLQATQLRTCTVLYMAATAGGAAHLVKLVQIAAVHAFIVYTL
jgi:hypothetical protein